MRTASRLVAALVLLPVGACRLQHAESGRPPGPPTVADSLARIEQDSTLNTDVLAALRNYYARLSAKDWRAIRAAFYPGGTVTTRMTPAGERTPRIAVQSADDFVRRVSEGAARAGNYSVRMLHAHVTGYGDVADAWVISETRMGKGRDSAVTRGIDAFHLYRDRGLWRITDLTWTGELASRPLVLPPRRARRASTPSATR